jgi:hypothetical protein
MRLRLLIDADVDDIGDLAEYIAAQRQVMVGYGGETRGQIGTLVGAMPITDAATALREEM